MANHSLTHLGACLYQIHQKDLEGIHLNINQAISILSLLSDWVIQSGVCTLSLEQQGMVDGNLCASIGLLRCALSALPEV